MGTRCRPASRAQRRLPCKLRFVPPEVPPRQQDHRQRFHLGSRHHRSRNRSAPSRSPEPAFSEYCAQGQFGLQSHGAAGRANLMASFSGYGKTIKLLSGDALVIHRAQNSRVVILEYEVHGQILSSGAPYDNRLISVITIENRKIVHWRDYMDSLAAWTALNNPYPCLLYTSDAADE